MPVAAPYSVEVKKPYVNALIYGSPGVGKTVFASSAQDHKDMQNVLFCNFEGGLLSVGSKAGISAVDIRSIEELEETYWKLVNKEKGWDKYQTVVLDSGSELQTLSLQEIATHAFKTNRGKRESVDDLFQSDYGKDSARLKRIFRMFRDAPFHVIITALAKKVYSKPVAKDAEPVLIDVVPAFTDKLGVAIMGYVDFVWYMFIDEEGNRKMLTKDKGAFRAKTRGQSFSKAIGDVVTNPTFAALYNTLLTAEGPQQK